MRVCMNDGEVLYDVASWAGGRERLKQTTGRAGAGRTNPMPFISSSKPRSSKSESASEGGLKPGQGRILFLSSCWVLALLPLPGAFRNRFHDRSAREVLGTSTLAFLLISLACQSEKKALFWLSAPLCLHSRTLYFRWFLIE
jgi:hypothetical protein